jgi:aminoacyl-tRNA hydrolase
MMTAVLDALTRGFSSALHRVDSRLPVLTHWPGARTIVDRGHARFIHPLQVRLFLHRTRRHRRRLDQVSFIGVTGSAGKTTTKDLIAAMASSGFRGMKSEGSGNDSYDVARAIRRVSADYRFAVVEVGATGPGSLDESLALLRPRIGVVTSVGTDHYSAFGSLEGIAAEKAKMVRALPADGIAVLNADDPRVLAMREGFAGRIITFGLHPEADVRAESVSAAWPDRLSFTMIHAGRGVPVQTQLCGAHWVSAALAAVAVGVALGVSLEESAQALGTIASFQGRMSPLALPNGVTVIRDDWKASIHTIPPALDFLKQARAPRKIAILGTIADTMGDAGAIYVKMARLALEAGDFVIFIGPRAFAALRAKKGAGDGRLRAFGSVKAATEFLDGFLRPGDLVLLKGSNTADHLYRIVLSRVRPVACWREDCKKNGFCDTCSLLQIPSDPPVSSAVRAQELTDEETSGQVTPPARIILGLGNPGEQYAGTPHNVGQAAVERLAQSLDAVWQADGVVLRADATFHGEPILLVKLGSPINHSGPALEVLTQRLGVTPDRCILIHDDLDLPLGAVRVRMRGSDGGHRGVRSILETFQTDMIPRVKIGVKRPGGKRPAAEAVLTPFREEERPVIEVAMEEALKRLDGMVGSLAPTRVGSPDTS